MSKAYIVALLFLNSCALDYGYTTPGATDINITVEKGISNYYLFPLSEFVEIFPKRPIMLPVNAPNVAEFLSDHTPISPSTTSFSLDQGDYIFSFTCGNEQIFQWQPIIGKSEEGVHLKC